MVSKNNLYKHWTKYVVDLDTVFVNRLTTELQYLAWILKGEYDKPI